MALDNINAASQAAPAGTLAGPPVDPTVQARATTGQLAQQYGISREDARRVQQQVLLQHPELTGAALSQAQGQAAALVARAGGSADSFQRPDAAAAAAAQIGGQSGTARVGPSSAQLTKVAQDASAGPVLPAPRAGQPDMAKLQTALPKMSFAEMANGRINWTALAFFVNRERMEHFVELLKQRQVVSQGVLAANLSSALTQALLVQVRVLSEQNQTLVGAANAVVEIKTDLARNAGGRLVGSDPISPLENLDISQTPKDQTSKGALSNQKRQQAILEMGGSAPTLPPGASSSGGLFAVEHDAAQATQANHQAKLAQASTAGTVGPAPEQVIGLRAYPGGPKLARSFLSPQEVLLLSPGNQLRYAQMVGDFNLKHENSLLTKEGVLSQEVALLHQAAKETRAAGAAARAANDPARADSLEAWANTHQARAEGLGPQVQAVRGEVTFLASLAYTSKWGLGEAQNKLAESADQRQTAEEEAKKANAQRVVARPVGAPASGVDALQHKADLANGIELEQNLQITSQAKMLGFFGRDQLKHWKTSDIQEDYHGRLAELQSRREAVAQATSPEAKETAERELALTVTGISAFRQSAPPKVVALLDLTRLTQTPADRATFATTIGHILAQHPPDRSMAEHHMHALANRAKAQRQEAVARGDADGAKEATHTLGRLHEQRLYLDGLLLRSGAVAGASATATRSNPATFKLGGIQVRGGGNASARGRSGSSISGNPSPAKPAAGEPISRAADTGLENLHRFDRLEVPFTPPTRGTSDEQLAARQAFARDSARATATGSLAAASAFKYEGFSEKKVLQQVAPQASDLSRLTDATNNSAQSLAGGTSGLAGSFTPELDQAFLRAYEQMQGMFYQLNALASRNVFNG